MFWSVNKWDCFLIFPRRHWHDIIWSHVSLFRTISSAFILIAHIFAPTKNAEDGIQSNWWVVWQKLLSKRQIFSHYLIWNRLKTQFLHIGTRKVSNIHHLPENYFGISWMCDKNLRQPNLHHFHGHPKQDDHESKLARSTQTIIQS